MQEMPMARARVSRTDRYRSFTPPTSRAVGTVQSAGCGRVRSRNVLPIAVRQGRQHREAAAAGEEQLGSCTAGQSKRYRLYLYSGKLTIAAMYFRRILVVGRSFAAGAPPLAHV
jgi:hypothetical protein